jgi:hypothetical protein
VWLSIHLHRDDLVSVIAGVVVQTLQGSDWIWCFMYLQVWSVLDGECVLLCESVPREARPQQLCC